MRTNASHTIELETVSSLGAPNWGVHVEKKRTTREKFFFACYGPKFFSSHSFRTGYANKVAEKLFSEAKTLLNVIDELVIRGLWIAKPSSR